MDFMSPKLPGLNMSRETFSDIISWVQKTPERNTIHLMGGEPTLNPDFEWMVEHLLARDFRITVFSNLATGQALDYAGKMNILPVTWVVNVNPPETWNEARKDSITEALKLLGPRANITFNIMPDAENNDWAINLINEYHLNKGIKVGFVLPTATGSNYYLDDDEYTVVARKLVELAKECEKYGIKIDYECGIPTCIFTDEQLGILWDTGNRFASSCYSRLDITPDGKCIYCLPLATKESVHFSRFETYLDAKNHFERKWAPLRRLGRTENCFECNLMQPGTCHGGCLAKMILNAKNV
jgi:radical SAM protein with 4Fe4S-binding SPASM domain